MSSINKQQKRAKRAKTKAKQTRIVRGNASVLPSIVPDYFMPDTVALDELDGDGLLEAYIDPDVLAEMDDEEREEMKALLGEDDVEMPTEDELLLMDVYESPAPEPSEEQRIAHYEELKDAEQESQHAMLVAFARGPVAAHALYNIDIADYIDVLTSTLGAYWIWAEEIDPQTARERIDNEEFLEEMRDALAVLEEESIMQLISDDKKPDESIQD